MGMTKHLDNIDFLCHDAIDGLPPAVIPSTSRGVFTAFPA